LRLLVRPAITAVAPFAALVLLPVFLTSFHGRTLATTAVIYAIVALGVALVYSQLGLLPMSHAALWGIGSYTTTLLIVRSGAPLWIAFPGAVLVTVVAGAVSGLPAFRVRGHYLLLLGFILTQLVVVVGQQWAGLTGGASGIVVPRGSGMLLGTDLSSLPALYYVSLSVLLLLMGFTLLVQRSVLGRRLRAVRENPSLAGALGLDERLLILAGYSLSGVFAGAGGALYAVDLQQIQPDEFGLNAAILLPLVVMLGGARHLWGPAAGAFVVVFLPEVIGLSPDDAQAANGLLLILIILLMPDGILGGPRAALEQAMLAVARLRRTGSKEVARPG
jgi:branched-chain amino acid transport system permease protein